MTPGKAAPRARPQDRDRLIRNWLLAYLGLHRGFVVLSLGAACLSAALSAALLPTTEILLTGVAGLHQPEQVLARELGHTGLGRFLVGRSAIELVIVGALSLIVLRLLVAVFASLHQYLSDSIISMVTVDMRRDMWRRVLRLPDPFFHGTQVGALHSLFTQELMAATTALGTVFLGPVPVVLSLLATGATAIWLDPMLGLCALGTAPLFWLASGPLSRSLKRRMKELRASFAVTSDDIQETLSAVREVKANCAEAREEAEWERSILGTFHAARAYRRANMVAEQGLKMLSESLPIAILAIGALSVLANPNADAAVLVTIYTAIPPLLAAVSALSGVKLNYTNALLHGEKIWELLQEPTEASLMPGERELVIPADWDPQRPVIEFEGVELRYPGTGYRVCGVSFQVRAGQTIAIVGAGGAGKSTVMNVLFKVFPYTAGSVRIYGQELRELSIPSLRRAFGYMTQFPYFFQRSLMENILYGTDERGPAVEARARHLVEMVDLDEMVASLPAGYETVVTNRGANFSGSQQKRLALCRALIRDPPLLLLDEPLSGLSPDQAREVIDYLVRLKGQRVVLMITHELDRLEHADLVLVFARRPDPEGPGEHGTIVEAGTFAELARSGPTFQKLRHGSGRTAPAAPAAQPDAAAEG